MDLTPWFLSTNRSVLAQIIFGFTLGVLLSPWDTGLFFLIVYRLLYELAFYFYLFRFPDQWFMIERIVIFCASFLGYVIGRSLWGLNPVDPKVPVMF